MRVWVLLATFIMASCGAKTVSPTFHAVENPESLSAWGVINVSQGELQLGEGVLPYALNTPLFTDYAHKLRTIWMPEGTAQYREDDILDFPVGTVISKTFYYPSSEGEMFAKKETYSLLQQRQG